MKKKILLFLLMTLICCCTVLNKKGNVTHEIKVIEKSNFSPELPDWINELFFYLENNAIYRQSIDWSGERKDIIERYKSSWNKDPAREYELIETLQVLVQKAGSEHSSFVYHEFLGAVDDHAKEVNQDTIESISFKEIDNMWGYIQMNTYYDKGESLDEKLIVKVSDVLHQAERNHVKGLIIDLSKNGGGNMYPPLAAISPILNNGDLGFFYDPVEKTKTAWAHDNGSIEIRDQNQVYWSFKNKDYYISPLRDVPKAILVSNQTGSSGEFILLSLAFQRQTKVFGQKTAGFTTGNEIFSLSDGSRLVLTTVFSMDTNGRIYNDALTPDVVTDDWDSAEREAIKWLSSTFEVNK